MFIGLITIIFFIIIEQVNVSIDRLIGDERYIHAFFFLFVWQFFVRFLYCFLHKKRKNKEMYGMVREMQKKACFATHRTKRICDTSNRARTNGLRSIEKARLT